MINSVMSYSLIFAVAWASSVLVFCCVLAVFCLFCEADRVLIQPMCCARGINHEYLINGRKTLARKDDHLNTLALTFPEPNCINLTRIVALKYCQMESQKTFRSNVVRELDYGDEELPHSS